MLSNFKLVYLFLAIFQLTFYMELHCVIVELPIGNYDSGSMSRHETLEKVLNNFIKLLESNLKNKSETHLNEFELRLLAFLLNEMNSYNVNPPQFWYSRQGRK